MDWFLLIIIRLLWSTLRAPWTRTFSFQSLPESLPFLSIKNFSHEHTIESTLSPAVETNLDMAVFTASNDLIYALSSRPFLESSSLKLFLVLFVLFAWKVLALRTHRTQSIRYDCLSMPVGSVYLAQDEPIEWDQYRAATVTESSCSAAQLESLLGSTSIDQCEEANSCSPQHKCVELSPIVTEIFKTPESSPESTLEPTDLWMVPLKTGKDLSPEILEVQVSYHTDRSSRPRSTFHDSDTNGDILFDLIKLYQQPLQYKRTRVIDDPIAEEKENTDASHYRGLVVPVSPPALSNHFKVHNPHIGEAWQYRVGLVRTTLVSNDTINENSLSVSNEMLIKPNIDRDQISRELRQAISEANEMEGLFADALANPAQHVSTIKRLQYITSIEIGHSLKSIEALRVVSAYKQFARDNLTSWIKWLPSLESSGSTSAMAMLVRNILVFSEGAIAASQYQACLHAYCAIASRPKSILFASLSKCMALIVAALDIEMVIPTFTSVFTSIFSRPRNCGRQQALMVVAIKNYISLHQDKMRGPTGHRIMDTISDVLEARSKHDTRPSPQLQREIASLDAIVTAVFPLNPGKDLSYVSGTSRLHEACQLPSSQPPHPLRSIVNYSRSRKVSMAANAAMPATMGIART